MSCHHRHSQVRPVGCATACSIMLQSSCDWCGHDRCHTTTGNHKCARLHVQPHATACHSQAVIGVVTTNVMPPQVHKCAKVACATACNSMPQPSCDWCGHDRCHATTGTHKCARLHVQPHATAFHSQAVIVVAMTDVMPPHAFSSVPGCMCNHMQQHATAKL